MENRVKILKILLVILIILFVIMLIRLNINSEKKEQKTINEELSTDKLIYLMKAATQTLNRSENLLDNSITDESMIKFATEYLFGKNITYTDKYIVANIVDVEEAVEYIFDRKINFSNVTYTVQSSSIYIPIYPISTDVKTYKFKYREYDENENTYISYIDCLESSFSQYSEIVDSSTTEYSDNNVIRTLVFKYKIKDGRKILLSYNDIMNVN